MTIEEISGYAIMILLVYSVYILPKALGESQGVFREVADPTFGKMKEDCKWTHGMTFKSMAIGFIGGVFLMVLVQVQVQEYFGIIASAIALLVILVPVTIYERRKSKENAKLAKIKNVKEGRKVTTK